MLKDKRFQEIIGIVLIIFAFILLLSIFSFHIDDYAKIEKNVTVNNFIGPLGALLSHGLRSAFGFTSYLLIVMCSITGWEFLKHGTLNAIIEKIFYLFYIVIVFSALISLSYTNVPQLSGGYIGFYIYKFLSATLNTIGAFIVILLLNFIGLILIGFISLSKIMLLKGNQVAATSKMQLFFKRLIENETNQKKVSNDFPRNKISEVYNERKKELNRPQNKIPWLTRLLEHTKGPLPWITKKTFTIEKIKSETLNEVPKLLDSSIPDS